VREQRSRLSVRPGEEQPARRRDRGRTCPIRRAEPTDRKAGAPLQEPAPAQAGDFIWQTRKSWSRERRVVAKAEWTGGEANPRFVVTSLAREEHEARHLYEKLYCARGEMENRIKSLPSRKRGSASSTFVPTVPRLIPCAPTSCACGSPQWPMC
jgi:hypothetical protein